MTNKPKRKHPFLYIPTGEIIYLDRIVDSQHYFVCWGEDFTLEDKYDRVKVSDLKEINSNKPTAKYRATPIKKTGSNRFEALKKYRRLRDKYFKEHPICEFPGCKSKNVTLHHMRGRTGSFLTDKRFFKSLCPKHHKFIEENPLEAKKLNLSQNRLTKTPDVTELMEKDLTNIKRHGNSNNL